MMSSRTQTLSVLLFTVVITSLYFLSYQAIYYRMSGLGENPQYMLEEIEDPVDLKEIKDHVTNQEGISNYTRIQEERIRNLKTVCQDKELFTQRSYRGSQSLTYYYSDKYNFAYCKVPKSGCTFWTQVFLILNNYSVEQTFSMKRSAVHGYGNKFSISSMELRIRNPRMILVSRDPYSRLYSGYIDKIYLGLFSAYRQKIHTEHSQCNFDITFEQFLQYIIENVRANMTINRHWAPIFSLCRPCDVNQYRLVKQESFSEDVELILKEIGLGMTKYRAITDVLHEHRAEATIPGIIETTIMINKRKKDVLECIGLSGVARRLWKSFQIQGFIHENIGFPDSYFTNEEDFVNHAKLSEAILETAKNHPMTSLERKQQRHQALVSAYKSVSKESINGIKEVFRPDFRLFNYDENPPT